MYHHLASFKAARKEWDSTKHQDQDTPCQLHRWERDFRLVSLSLRHHVAPEWAAPNGWAPPCRMEGSNMGRQSKNPQFLHAHFKWKLNILMGSLYLVLVTYVNSWNEQPTLVMPKKNSIKGPTHGPTHFVVLWSSRKMSPQSTIIMILCLEFIICNNQETSWFHVRDSFYTFWYLLITVLHVK